MEADTIYAIMAGMALLVVGACLLGALLVISFALRCMVQGIRQIWGWYSPPATKIGSTPFREATICPPAKGTPWHLFRQLAWLLLLFMGCGVGWWYINQPSTDPPTQVREPPSHPIVYEGRCPLAPLGPVIMPEPKYSAHPTMLRRIPRCVDRPCSR